MSKNSMRIVSIASVVLIASALAACGKNEGKKVDAPPLVAAPSDKQSTDVLPKSEATSPPIAATNNKPSNDADPKGALRQLASQKSAADAARCGIVFTTAADAAANGGDAKAAANMRLATRATQFVIDVAVTDHGESVQSVKNIQMTVGNEVKSWSKKEFETYVQDCTKKFVDLAPLMVRADLAK